MHGHKEVVLSLLNHGASINIKNNYGRTALMYASDRGHNEVVLSLLDRSRAPQAREIWRESK